MTTTDKTRQKLMDSMHRTKASSTSAEPAQKKRVTRKRAGTARKPASSAPAKQATHINSGTPQTSTDPYQGGRRVWPD
ncbi:MAG: hypothetical protein ABFS24_12205 [Pseudomonadota bacterium]